MKYAFVAQVNEYYSEGGNDEFEPVSSMRAADNYQRAHSGDNDTNAWLHRFQVPLLRGLVVDDSTFAGRLQQKYTATPGTSGWVVQPQ